MPLGQKVDSNNAHINVDQYLIETLSVHIYLSVIKT